MRSSPNPYEPPAKISEGHGRVTTTLFLVHPSGKSRRIDLNFCWLGFFLPTVWSVSEGLWRPFAFSLLGYYFLTKSSNLARDLGIPAIALLGLSYFVIMVVFGVHGKKWVASDMLAHGYRELRIDHENPDG